MIFILYELTIKNNLSYNSIIFICKWLINTFLLESALKYLNSKFKKWIREIIYLEKL